MAAGESWPLCLLFRIQGEAPALAGLDEARRETWWRETLPGALDGLASVGARSLGFWRSDWASDYQLYFAHEYPTLESLERGVETLRRVGFFRYLNSSRLLGRRWSGEPGWNADRWSQQEAGAALGGILYYRISESFYSLAPDQVAERHDQRRELLARAIERLIDRGGRRLGAYHCEWSSEWHLFVLYEFPDLEALEEFNQGLPERRGYMDYDIVFTLGRRLPGPAAIGVP